MRALLLAADFGVLPAANSPSVDFMLWLTACRPDVIGETKNVQVEIIYFILLKFILNCFFFVDLFVC